MIKAQTYIDVCQSAGNPLKLLPHIVTSPVWPAETLEHHTECLRLFNDERGLYNQMDALSRALLDSRTLVRLQTLVNFAYRHVPFYHELYSGVGFEPGDLKSLHDFNLLPVVSKSDLLQVQAELKDNPFHKVNFVSRTSGSTGIPLSVVNDTDRQRNWFVKRLQMFEQMLGEKLAPEDWIYSIYYEPFFLTSLLGDYRTFTVGLAASPEDVAEHIRQLQPKVITGVANQVLKVGKLLPDALDIGIKVFTTNSESSSRTERQLLSAATGVPVLDEYSSEELGIIAWEQRDGSYLVAEDNVHLELLPGPDSELKQVVGTDLWNFTMPRIRYSQGDYAQWQESPHTSGLKRLSRIVGREDMTLMSRTSGAIDPGLVLEIFDTTLLPATSGVAEFRLVQEELGQLRLLLKADSTLSLNETALEECRQRITSLFAEPVSISVELLAMLPNLGVKKRCILRNFHV